MPAGREAGASCDEDVLMATMERLLSEGVDLDTQDQRGMSALHLAAMHGLSRIVNRLLREPDVREKLRSFGTEPAGGSVEELAAFIAEERVRWKQAVEFSRSQ